MQPLPTTITCSQEARIGVGSDVYLGNPQLDGTSLRYDFND